MERRRKQMEEARAQRVEAEPPQTRVLSRAEKLKLREDEFVPPDE